MARKKFYIDKIEIPQAENKNIWNVALYVRLSREDGDKRESDSVVNQKKLLNYYVENHEELLSSSFYIDENYTGTNFDRPGFQRMIKDVKNGDINCIIVKDLSRFAREYIGAGNYLENVLPKYNCRFISILDDVDTKSNPDSVTDLMVRIKSLLHDYNSQRISINVRATKDSQRREGKYISPLAPFGYNKDPDNKHKLIIDQTAKSIIENIYDWYLSGMGDIRIAQKLNELGIATRAQYRKTGNLYNTMFADYSWRPNAIQGILTNKVYIGAVDQRRETTRNYKNRTRIILDDKDHFIVYDMHEPIINRKKFDRVQNKRKTLCAKTSRHENKLYTLSGLLKCNDCGYAMLRNQTFIKGRWYVYYKCRAYNQRGATVCNHNHSMREKDIISATLAVINIQIQSLIDIKELITQINFQRQIDKKNINSIINFDRMIEEKKKKIKQIKNLKVLCYSDWKDQNIDKDDYLLMKDKYDSSLLKLQNEILALDEERKLQNTIKNCEFDWIDNIIKDGKIEKLTREIAISLIDTIHVDQNKHLDIDFKFTNEYEKLKDYIYSIASAV